jgi:hypothetical protein
MITKEEAAKTLDERRGARREARLRRYENDIDNAVRNADDLTGGIALSNILRGDLEELIARYTKAGWKVNTSGDCNTPLPEHGDRIDFVWVYVE